MENVRILTVLTILFLMVGCSASPGKGVYTSGAVMKGKATVEGVIRTARIVYQTTESDRVKVHRDVEFTKDRFMDIYYPPDFDQSAKMPAVVFTTLYDKTTSGRQIGWGLLMASHGVIGITFGAAYPEKDTRELFRYINSKGDSLGIDTANLGVFSWCNHSRLAATILGDATEPYYKSITYAVFLYGIIPPVETLRPGLEVLVVRAGKDTSSALRSVDTFVARARADGATVEVIDYREGTSGFDFTEFISTPSEYITPPGREKDVEIIKQVLEKIQDHFF